MQPGWIVALGAALAIGLAAITCALTRTDEWIERPRDSQALALAAEDLQVELDRLYSRYVDKLGVLAADVWRSRGNTFGPERTAARIVGVRTISVLALSEGQDEFHVEIREQSGWELPFEAERFREPTFLEESTDGRLVLARSQFESVVSHSGWIRSGSDVFYFWKKLGASGVLLIGIDGRSVRGAISDWLSDNEELSFHEMRSVAGEFTRLAGPDGRVVFQSGEAPDESRSPQIFPATLRFGTWQVQAWGVAEREIRWLIPYLVTGLGLSFLLFAGSLAVAGALRRATRVARQRVSFVNRASHELRTPITNMMLNVDLARELVEEDPPAARIRLDRVSGEASRLSRLVDNLLTFSRSENGTDRLHPVAIDPVAVLEGVLGQFEMSLDDREIEVAWKDRESVLVVADPDALAQVFGNLISNVEKYAASGGLLEISTSVHGEDWRAAFSDRGPGVQERNASRIFEPFHRERDEVNEGVSGTGLGLSIARDLARRMKGDLTLEPSREGATFQLSLPLAE